MRATIDKHTEVRQYEHEAYLRESPLRAGLAVVVGRAGCDVTVQYEDDIATKAALEQVFGYPISEEDLEAMSGAHPGDVVHVSNSGLDLIEVRVESATIRRDFTVERRGYEVILFDEYTTNNAPKTTASGADVVRTMENMLRVGVTRIDCMAARGSNLNGYYTWARLGFTGKIPVDDMADDVLLEMQAKFGKVTEVEQLMRKPGGAQWWKRNGVSWQASFSFSNRYSLRILTYFKMIVARHGDGDDASNSERE